MESWAVEIARTLGDAKRFARAVLGISRPEEPFANSSSMLGESFIGLYEEAMVLLGNEDDKILRAKLYFHLAGEMFHNKTRPSAKSEKNFRANP